jgi:hypothetical protein
MHKGVLAIVSERAMLRSHLRRNPTMALMIETTRPPERTAPVLASQVATSYHFEGEIRDGTPAVAFFDGLRLMGTCEASVEAVSLGPSGPVRGRVTLDVRGIIDALDWEGRPAPSVIAAPGFDFPDLDLHLTGSAYVRASHPENEDLGGSVVSIEGWVNLESGELVFEGQVRQGDSYE